MPELSAVLLEFSYGADEFVPVNAAAPEELDERRYAKESGGSLGLKEDDLVIFLKLYFLRILAGMIIVLLFVTVDVSVNSIRNRHFHERNHEMRRVCAL